MNPNIQTKITGWLATDRHAQPLDSAYFTVYVALSLNGVQVGSGFCSRPFRDMPYVTNDAELQETEFWKQMVEEAKGKAMAESGKLLETLKGEAA